VLARSELSLRGRVAALVVCSEDPAMSRHPSRVLPIAPLFMAISVTLVAAVGVFVWVGPAAGQVVEGTCTGSVTMEGQLVVDVQQLSSAPVEIPDRGTAEVAGSFELPPAEAPVPYRGELRGRHAFGTFLITSWDGQSTTPEVVAERSYELPNVIPRGSGPIPVVLDAVFGDESCRVVGTVAVAGPTFDGLTVAMLLVTGLLLGATAASGRSRARGSGRPLVGAITGLLAGGTGALALFGAGTIALDSNVWFVAPLLLGALGVTLGAVAPFGRPPAGDADRMSDVDRMSDAEEADVPAASGGTGGAGGSGGPDDAEGLVADRPPA
jgi:hypothetical protein